MVEEYLDKIRELPAFDRAIVPAVTVYRGEKLVEIKVITDKTYSDGEKQSLNSVLRAFVPEEFNLKVVAEKLSPDEKMVARKIFELLPEIDKAVSAFITEEDIKVEKTERGFYYTLLVTGGLGGRQEVAQKLSARLKKCFCGEFDGKCEKSDKSLDDVEIEEEHENIEYIVPIRHFEIADFELLEGSETRKTAVYMADMNFESESVTVCGTIENISERTFTRNNGQEKPYFSFTLSDTTATMRATYFSRQRTIDKIRQLKEGDSIVLTGKSEIFRGSVRFTADTIDLGKVPQGFTPERRKSKPAPKYYECVFPEEFEDFTQTDLFSDNSLPECLKSNTFVVFDLETTGLNSSPSGGNMDRIIEIGAYKIIDGNVKERFSTFVNPERPLSEEIIRLTGITPEMVADAPNFRQVMPDFFKFCQGSYLVGHNIAGFDFKFIDYYLQQLGYVQERKLFDTVALSQAMLFLKNYKLNTVADYFGITFNHHRAVDDALVTAKIFIELIKLKKSLPKPC